MITRTFVVDLLISIAVLWMLVLFMPRYVDYTRRGQVADRILKAVESADHNETLTVEVLDGEYVKLTKTGEVWHCQAADSHPAAAKYLPDHCKGAS